MLFLVWMALRLLIGLEPSLAHTYTLAIKEEGYLGRKILRVGRSLVGLC